VVHHERNRFGSESLPELMLVHIMNFLAPKVSSISQRVCGAWRRALISSLARRLLAPSLVIGATYRRHWDTRHKPRSMALAGSHVVICDPTSEFLELWNLDGQLQDRYEVGTEVHKITANDTFICINQNSNLSLLPIHGGQRVREWEIPHCNGLALTEDLIYVSSISSVLMYSLEGKLVSQFPLQAPESHLARRIAIYNNEIFILDHRYSCLQVYNPKGKLLRSWAKCGKKPGEFRDPWGIAVTDQRIYVVDAGNARIQGFNLGGDFLFECRLPNAQELDLADICVVNETLFVSDWNRRILAFQLIYS